MLRRTEIAENNDFNNAENEEDVIENEEEIVESNDRMIWDFSNVFFVNSYIDDTVDDAIWCKKKRIMSL